MTLYATLIITAILGALAAILGALAAIADAFTPLGLLNFLVLQWFGVRLARVQVPGVLVGRALRVIREGQLVTAADVDTTRPLTTWKMLRWIWPLTGWWTDFRYIARRT